MVQISLQNFRWESGFLTGIPWNPPLGTSGSESTLVTSGGTAPLGLTFKDFVHFLKNNKETLDKVSYGSGQKCSKELNNLSFTSVETTVVKL